MCLVALSLGQHPRFPFVLASNRDEFFDRPSAPLAWWQEGELQLLAGRDLRAGGSWLGLSAQGRLAWVTNVREPGGEQPQAASRGELVLQALRGDTDLQAALEAPRNGYNLCVAQPLHGRAHWYSNRPRAQQRALAPGLHGLSNAALDTPWPKVVRLRERLAKALAVAPERDALFEALLGALADAGPAPDADLPDTGIGLARERQLSSAFIRIAGPDGRALYGTRCSTLVLLERDAARARLWMLERRFDALGGIAGEYCESLVLPPGNP